MHEIIFKKHLAQQSLAFADTQLAFKGEGTKRIPSGCLMSTPMMLSHGSDTVLGGTTPATWPGAAMSWERACKAVTEKLRALVQAPCA